MVKNQKQLLEALDNHWAVLGYCIEVTPKPKSFRSLRGNSIATKRYDSIRQAMEELHLKGKSVGSILRSLTGKKEFVYDYNWKLVKLKL